MPATPLTATNISLGPGYLYWAPIGTPEPADIAASLDAAFKQVGFTKDGSTFTVDMKAEGIKVAEELPPVLWDLVDQEVGMAFEAAEDVLATWKLVLSGGIVTTNANGAQITPLAPTTTPTRYMILWQSFDVSVRIILRKALQTGSVQVKRAKSPNYATFPLNFMAESPGAGIRLFNVQLNNARA
jgi:hypothetical protein